MKARTILSVRKTTAKKFDSTPINLMLESKALKESLIKTVKTNTYNIENRILSMA
jgi:hypothetical protein